MDLLCAGLKLILVYLFFSSLPLKLYLETKLISEVSHVPVVSVSSSKRYNLEPDNNFSSEKNAFLLRQQELLGTKGYEKIINGE